MRSSMFVMEAKLRSTTRTTEFTKLLNREASSRLSLHCWISMFHVGQFVFQFRLLLLSIPPARRTAIGAFPHPFTMVRAWLKTAEAFPPYGRRPADESNNFTASCSEKIRTKTSWTIPFPNNEGVRVVTRIRNGFGSTCGWPGCLAGTGAFRVSKMNHLASSTLQTSSRQIKILRFVIILSRSSFIASSSPPWKRCRLSANRIACSCFSRTAFSNLSKLVILEFLDIGLPSSLFPSGEEDLLLSPSSSSSSSSPRSFETSCRKSSSYNRRISFSVNGVRPSWIHAIPSEKRSRTSTVWIVATARVVFPFPGLSACRDVIDVILVLVCNVPKEKVSRITSATKKGRHNEAHTAVLSSVSIGPVPECSSKQLTTCFIKRWRWIYSVGSFGTDEGISAFGNQLGFSVARSLSAVPSRFCFCSARSPRITSMSSSFGSTVFDAASCSWVVWVTVICWVIPPAVVES